jgi:hypothetical protein
MASLAQHLDLDLDLLFLVRDKLEYLNPRQLSCRGAPRLVDLPVGPGAHLRQQLKQAVGRLRSPASTSKNREAGPDDTPPRQAWMRTGSACRSSAGRRASLNARSAASPMGVCGGAPYS